MHLMLDHAARPVRAAQTALPKRNLLQKLRAMLAVTTQRRQLSQLPAHLLQDIGVTPENAQKEAQRAPWDVPAHWRA